MKKILALLTALVMLVCVCSFAGCATTLKPVDTQNTDKQSEQATEAANMTLVLLTETPTVFTVNLHAVNSENGLIGVLDALKTEGKLTYTANGGFLTAVGDLAQDAANGVYLYLYTTVTEDVDVSEYATTITYEGKEITSSGVGASDMHLQTGCTVVIGTIVYAS